MAGKNRLQAGINLNFNHSSAKLSVSELSAFQVLSRLRSRLALIKSVVTAFFTQSTNLMISCDHFVLNIRLVHQIPPVNQFLNIFGGLLSQHIEESTIENARTRLVEVHKWYQCLVAPVSIQSDRQAVQ